MKAGNLWIFFRLAVIAAMTIALLSIPEAQSNLDWPAAIFCGIVSSVFLYFWLIAIRSRSSVDWSEPYSLKQPFFPMNKFPVRYWLVVSYSLVIGGGIVVLRDIVERNGHEAVAGTFLVMGLFISTALKLWMKRFAR